MSITIKFKIDDRELKRLISATGGKGPMRIVADGVEYGLYVELGTVKMPARPCARPAAEAVRAGFDQAFMNKLTDAQITAAVDKTAFDIERLWKQNIEAVGAVDTGAYVNSIHVVSGTGPSMREVSFVSRRAG